jgi:Cation efflux family
MAAEGVHSIVDVSSGGMMLSGYRQSQRGLDRHHPLGHGRELYFWSFVVALLFLTLGAGFSIFEGVQRIISPSAVRSTLIIEQCQLEFEGRADYFNDFDVALAETIESQGAPQPPARPHVAKTAGALETNLVQPHRN